MGADTLRLKEEWSVSVDEAGRVSGSLDEVGVGGSDSSGLGEWRTAWGENSGEEETGVAVDDVASEWPADIPEVGGLSLLLLLLLLSPGR